MNREIDSTTRLWLYGSTKTQQPNCHRMVACLGFPRIGAGSNFFRLGAVAAPKVTYILEPYGNGRPVKLAVFLLAFRVSSNRTRNHIHELNEDVFTRVHDLQIADHRWLTFPGCDFTPKIRLQFAAKCSIT